MSECNSASNIAWMFLRSAACRCIKLKIQYLYLAYKTEEVNMLMKVVRELVGKTGLNRLFVGAPEPSCYSRA